MSRGRQAKVKLGRYRRSRQVRSGQVPPAAATACPRRRVVGCVVCCVLGKWRFMVWCLGRMLDAAAILQPARAVRWGLACLREFLHFVPVFFFFFFSTW